MHCVGHLFNQGMTGLHAHRHICQLLSNDLVFNELLPKRRTHHAILDGLCEQRATGSIAPHCGHPPLMVKVVHNHFKSDILFPNEILGWNFDIVKEDPDPVFCNIPGPEKQFPFDQSR